jgi:hypothetical protein
LRVGHKTEKVFETYLYAIDAKSSVTACTPRTLVQPYGVIDCNDCYANVAGLQAAQSRHPDKSKTNYDMPIGMKKELHQQEHKQILGISLVGKNTQSTPSSQIGKGNVATSLVI